MIRPLQLAVKVRECGGYLPCRLIESGRLPFFLRELGLMTHLELPKGIPSTARDEGRPSSERLKGPP